MSKIGMVFAILGSFIFWIPSPWVRVFGLVLLILGFIFSLVSLFIGVAGKRGIGFSVTGLLISFVCLVITMMFFIPSIRFAFNSLTF